MLDVALPSGGDELLRNSPKKFSGIIFGIIWRFVGSARVVILGFFCYTNARQDMKEQC